MNVYTDCTVADQLDTTVTYNGLSVADRDGVLDCAFCQFAIGNQESM